MNNVKQSELWIGGQHVAPSSAKYFDDLNPLDDSLYARVAEATAADMDKAVQVAHEAFKANKHLLARDREVWFMQAAALVERDFQEYVDILIDEVGSPLGKAEFEVAYCISALRAAAGVPRSLRGDIIPSDNPGVFSMAIREPRGVVAAISPFNVPLLKASKQGAMPLACGNAVVLLPSEFSAQVSLRFAQTLHEAGVPAGLFNVVTGNPFEIGDVLTTHKKVKSITFCGSPRVGTHVAELAAKDLKPITLELGGKSPLIVLDDADLDEAVQAAAMGTFFFQGQACMASSRIYLQRGIADEFTRKFVAAAGQASMGDLRNMETFVGPIISERQRVRVRRHIADAKSKGVQVLAGGEWDGNRCQPTVLSGVTEAMEVCRDETFGPVTSLYVFDTVDEAMELANDTVYGLSFSIFTRDIDTALDMAHRAESGAVHINRPTIQDEPCPPFGGQGLSGSGREGTEADLDILTEWKWITIRMAKRS
ncbi:MAG: aldehyde dehydrogenase family protein [Pseudomonadales bacterium]|nr:aldehyde dehydrogenase family protein [Halioglobus sp.]MCP5193805.1 aldehyde dehydrogenase family protein [Pseudomonadales bacterium]